MATAPLLEHLAPRDELDRLERQSFDVTIAANRAAAARWHKRSGWKSPRFGKRVPTSPEHVLHTLIDDIEAWSAILGQVADPEAVLAMADRKAVIEMGKRLIVEAQIKMLQD